MGGSAVVPSIRRSFPRAVPSSSGATLACIRCIHIGSQLHLTRARIWQFIFEAEIQNPFGLTDVLDDFAKTKFSTFAISFGVHFFARSGMMTLTVAIVFLFASSAASLLFTLVWWFYVLHNAAPSLPSLALGIV